MKISEDILKIARTQAEEYTKDFNYSEQALLNTVRIFKAEDREKSLSDGKSDNYISLNLNGEQAATFHSFYKIGELEGGFVVCFKNQ